MRPVTVLSVVGARPNFMKMAPVLRQLAREPQFSSVLVHTGQHYDESMSGVFLRELAMPEPDFRLEVGSGTHAAQTAAVLQRFELVCLDVKPDLVVVAGDVNSTLACALAAVKLEIPVAHIEAGLRSFDRRMPEEINRILTDSIAQLLFTTEASGIANLRREGVVAEQVHFVGNTMIDSLVLCRDALEPMDAVGSYVLATVHRPANVDAADHLARVLDILEAASALAPVYFVTHPRTRARLAHQAARPRLVQIDAPPAQPERGVVYLLPPLPYLEFFRLMSYSAAVLTDSGGVQEETTFLGVPCLTLRENTERPSTVTLGTNELVGLDRERVQACLETILCGRWKAAAVPPLWDGHAAERVVDVLRARFRPD
ncbi:MAG TPA: UDP-N-acetylglucosamine 2-epimerase (non-hydrolyzing) [Gemmatimonadales bacterium]|nr:UDP-N-acetylglucosamine 2-epimerase (non-hydrolyzing) [Gemmatimonadales bacterium]